MLKKFYLPLKLPLRLVLIVPFVLQIFTAVGLVGWLSFRNGQKAVSDLARQLQWEVSDRISEHLEDYLEIPHRANRNNLDIIGRYNLWNPENMRPMQKHFYWQIKNVFPEFKYMGFGGENKEFAGASRVQNEKIVVDFTDRSTNFINHIYQTDAQGNYLGNPEEDPEYDPRVRPWYQATIKAKKPIWSDIYPDHGYPGYNNNGELVISATAPYYDSNGIFRGVTLIDLSLQDLSKFLHSLKIGKSGQAFIVDHQNLLVASSTLSSPVILEKGEPQRIPADRAANTVIRSTSAAIFKKLGTLAKIEDSKQLSFNFNGEKQFARIIPLKDPRGLNWFIIVVIPESDFMVQINANTRVTIALCLAALIIATGLGIKTARWIVQPIQSLQEASEAISKGNLAQEVKTQPIEEVNSLAQSFNSMAQQLSTSFAALEQTNTELFQLNQAYERFVPYQFLEFLDKSSIIDVQLGDQIQLEMSILFSDIRDFTTLSETMTPNENFRFLNSYFSRMEPAITNHQGFIDKYIGDAIMALFSGEADNAIKAGIMMLETLRVYNQHRLNSGYHPIQIGIGINTGSLMLGTIGGRGRMESTVISDAVNIASRIEGLTKSYRTPLLISQPTFKKLVYPEQYLIREIDTVRIKGKSKQVTIYEVFDADEPIVRDRKLTTLPLFQEAIYFYQLYDLEAAEKLFQECLSQNPDDQIAKIYLDRCQEMTYRFRVKILEETYQLLRPKSQEFSTFFYDHLFAQSEEIKAMFTNTDLEAQKQKLWNSIELVIENIRKPELISITLRGLGATHLRYGVLPRHYPLVGQSIMASLNFCLGEAMTPEIEQAWADAYGVIQQLMVTGAEEFSNNSRPQS